MGHQRLGKLPAHRLLDCRDFAVFIGGANPSLRDDQAYSPAHHAAVCQKFGDPAAVDRYETIFVDSITVAGRLCFQWCKGQPEAFSEKTGKPDVRGAYPRARPEGGSVGRRWPDLPKHIATAALHSTETPHGVDDSDSD